MRETATILVVDDEASIRTIARAYLEQAGFTVVCVDNGLAALQAARDYTPAMIILDLNLPGMDGMEVAARLREHSDVFILMLTARSDEADRVAGLRIGADDYLTKPFSPRELAARVEAILRRRRGVVAPTNELRFKHVVVDPDSREARAGGQLLDLSPTEFDVLMALARHPGRALSREQLIDLVWGTDFFGTDRVVDVYVGQVRRKIEAVTGQTVIGTVRGIGYRFTDERL
ncbi:response regulator transcription factor [Candidatus Chloroploca sp. M-50]|uniref:Response regulator transcription factor n=1 Tax=Candidatus Chloroploca mongolica TaxID=2528176 RepID=A0ABS4DFC8_9CHLR|nr:response regulator transcription factor [Candidatus Chloroploca mongolica]MBP1468136.1 response regulator transcription factor [Candidatus Chloroploca mongolica]